MQELIQGIGRLGFWSLFTDAHGLLAMTSLILFGAALILHFLSKGNPSNVSWLKSVNLLLFINIAALDIFGLSVYVPYRTTGGPRTILKSSPNTKWLHSIVFEHKEFLAFAPLVLTCAAYLVVKNLGPSFSNHAKYKWLRRSVLASLILSLFFVLVVAGEAVIVTKIAPVG